VDPEPVLLVDHRHGQVLELHPLLDQRVGSDHQVDLAGSDPLQHAGPALAGDARRQHPVGELPVGPLVAQDQLALGPVLAHLVGAHRREELAHLQEVLRGQDLGRGHDGRLVAGLDRDHRRVQGDHRLARSDVALQQPVHRRRPLHVGLDLGDRLALAGGGIERQRGQEPLRERPGEVVLDAGRLRGDPVLAEGHAQLQREELVELQSLGGRPELGLVVREVDAAQRRRQGLEVLVAADGLGQRIVEALDAAQGVEHQAADHPGRQALGGGMDGDDPPGVHGLGGVAADDVHRRVGQAELAAERGELPRRHDFLLLLEPLGRPRLVEPEQLQEAGAVPDRHRDHGLAPPGHGPVDPFDRADDGSLLADPQLADGDHRGAIDVATGVVVEQVVQGVDVELVGEHLVDRGTSPPPSGPRPRGECGDAAELRDRSLKGKRLGAHSTPNR
jgi:hypothetical protein